MKAAKRAELIAEAFNAGRLAGHRPIIYSTIDIVTGIGDKPQMLAIPFLPHELMESGHLKIDLPRMGYRLVRIED